ncbi:hypothetical protein PILCRDRAFT_828268 [Piloderma croceum F 1598]|uniref:Uncharacterized protein n=1 Tax=Piloderma croceum (strain F 1598) TaxID=765440 RepID=A0A0C3F2X1_PILCF|nr:hypothetical protein PILCRDRAFT_828268 [Piloderma croceum F 1598]
MATRSLRITREVWGDDEMTNGVWVVFEKMSPPGSFMLSCPSKAVHCLMLRMQSDR